MKKIAFLFVAVCLMMTANAQLVVGLQGGYYQQKNTNSVNTDFTFASNYVGGLRLGYMITPKLFVGVSGSLLGNNGEQLIASDSAMHTAGGNTQYYPTRDHRYTTEQSGWNAAAQVRYELLKYGNMHFNLLLQGTYSTLGYTQHTESFYWVGYPNAGEYHEPVNPYADSISRTAWNISLRPTLTYEFSKHLSAELSLDFLSVGYINETTAYEGQHVTVDGKEVTPATTVTTLYAGLNTLMETLRWESPMLRLGFNWTF